LAKAYLRYRNPRRRGVGRQHAAFHERIWNEAAAELGATCTSLGSGIFEIARDGAFTRVFENVSAIDDPPTLAALHDKPITSRLLEGARVARPASRDVHAAQDATRDRFPAGKRRRLRGQTRRRHRWRPRRHNGHPPRLAPDAGCCKRGDLFRPAHD